MALPRRYLCDFCNSPNPIWSYPVDDFSQTLNVREDYVVYDSRGGWAGCAECEVYIAKHDTSGLVEHTLEKYGLPPEVEQRVRERLSVLFEEFFAMLLGEPEPLESMR